MRKKKVVSVFGVLILMGIVLSIFSFHNFGSLTGRVVDGSYTEDLFVGQNYEFHFYPSLIGVKEGALLVEGDLREIAGKDHELQATIYVFDTNGNNVNTLSREIFLGSDEELLVKLRIDIGNKDVAQVLAYFEDEQTSIKIHKEFSKRRSISGYAVSENSDDGNSAFPFLVGVLVLVSAVLFVVSRVRQHKKQENLESLFASRTHRKYIDLDVR